MDPMTEKVRQDLQDANQEIAQLRAKILAVEKLAMKYQAFLDLYEDGVKNDAGPPMPRFIQGSVQASIPIEESQTAKARITNLVALLLADGGQKSTKELLEEIQKRGVEPGSKDKYLALSALLSKDGRFVPDRKRGWSLKEDAPSDW
jgi:hypothetical protein